METYIDFGIITMLHIHSWVFDNDGEGLSAYLQNTDDIWCSCVVFVFIALVYSLPFWALWVVHKNFTNIGDQEVQDRY